MIVGNREFHFDRHVYVMGILNVTPDSFSDGGLYSNAERALDRALEMEEEGADLIDIGGESTRPGAEPILEEEELRRVLPIVRSLTGRLKIPVSIDTQRAEVARAAIGEGVAMVNDVSALGDPEMAAVVSHHRVPVILMHRKGESKTMQENPSYEDVLDEVSSFLAKRVHYAEERGIPREKIMIDPGLGFGKRFEDNLMLLRLLTELKTVHQPLVIGASRKAFLRKIFGADPTALLSGSVAAALMAAERGAALIRVHDVAPTKAAINLAGLGELP